MKRRRGFRDRTPSGLPAEPAGLMTHREAARRCRVGSGMILRWVAVGLWPLPCAVRGTTRYFRAVDVDDWVRSGIWADGARYRGGRMIGPGTGGIGIPEPRGGGA